MSGFLLKLLELSLQAGLLILAILLVRLLFKKLPAKYLCLLWAVVALRLMIPVSFESGYGLMPGFASRAENKTETIYGTLIDEAVYDYNGNLLWESSGDGRQEKIEYYLGEAELPSEETDYFLSIVEKEGFFAKEGELWQKVPQLNEGNNHNQIMEPTPVPKDVSRVMIWRNRKLGNADTAGILTALWGIGVALMLGYSVYGCMRIRRLVKNSILYEDTAFLCDGLDSPFLFGWIHPKVYLPTNLEETQIQYVMLHEKSHISRGDHYSKLLGYVLLSVYWFQPLIWVAYVLFCKDVERACDERVIRKLSAEDRKGYAETLLQCSTDRRFIITNPLAFSETDVKKRIAGILGYKAPGRWVTMLAVLLCVAATAGCFFVRNDDQGETPKTVFTQFFPLPDVSTPMPTPLPPSDLTLLGNCTRETVLPVPFGQTISIDLNGDGAEEAVTFGLEGYEGNVSLYELEEAHKYTYEKVNELYYLKINDRVWSQPEIAEEFWDNHGVGSTTYYIFDVDTSDNYKEIGIYFPGPNTPTGIALFRYFNGEIYCIGNFMSPVLEADEGSYESWKMPYEEMVTNVKREGYLITVPGDGTILCEERRDCMETAFSVQKYKLYDATSGRYASLRQVLRDRYEFSGWQDDRQEFNIRAAKDFYAYLEPVDMSVEVGKDALITEIPEGTRISFYAYYPDNGWPVGWIQFAYGENLEHFAWFYKGGDATGRFMLYFPDATEKSSSEVFDNLSHAG